MTVQQTRLAELLDRLEETVSEIRACLRQGEETNAPVEAKQVEAFADEAFRDRDA